MANLPNYIDHVAAVAARYPDAWRNAHTGGPRSDDFIKLLAAELHAIDERVGLNGKRGNPDDLSDDALCYRAPGNSIDVRTGERVCVIDVIAAAGSPDARPSWGEVWDAANVPTKATWVQPEKVEKPVTPPPVTPPAPQIPAELLARLDTIQSALTFVINQTQAMRNDSHQLHNQFGTFNERLADNTLKVEDVRSTLRNGLQVTADGEASAGWIGRVRMALLGVAKG